jgi:general secretion pathway protein M
MKERIGVFWSQLSDRDRSMLLVGGIVCFFYLFYALMYAPLSHSKLQHQQQLLEDKATLTWMKQVKSQAHPERKSAEKVSSAQLLTLLSDNLQKTNFKSYSYQLQQSGTNEILLSYEEVPYNQFMAWLSAVSREYVFLIKQLQIQRKDKHGVVKVSLFIEVSG